MVRRLLLSTCLFSLYAALGDSTLPPRAPFPHENELQPARGPTEQHAIPERLLTNKQAAALLSGIPAHLRVAKAQHREAFLQLAEPGLEKEPGRQSCALVMQCPALLQCPAASHALPVVRAQQIQVLTMRIIAQKITGFMVEASLWLKHISQHWAITQPKTA